MGKITGIRDLDEETFRKLRAVAIEENIRVGDAVNAAMKKWLAEKGKRKNKNQISCQIRRVPDGSINTLPTLRRS